MKIPVRQAEDTRVLYELLFLIERTRDMFKFDRSSAVHFLFRQRARLWSRVRLINKPSVGTALKNTTSRK